MEIQPCRRQPLLLFKRRETSEPVPYHGAKEIPEPLRRKIAKGMGVK